MEEEEEEVDALAVAQLRIVWEQGMQVGSVLLVVESWTDALTLADHTLWVVAALRGMAEHGQLERYMQFVERETQFGPVEPSVVEAAVEVCHKLRCSQQAVASSKMARNLAQGVRHRFHHALQCPAADAKR